jgi:hypothetical protein
MKTKNNFIKYNKVLDAANGHYKQWVEASIAMEKQN